MQSGHPGSQSLAIRLRDILLQGKSNPSEEIRELIGATCYEAHLGISPATRTVALSYLTRFCSLAAGKLEFTRFGRPGGILEALADKVFTQYVILLLFYM